ncbi:protein-glutamate O-methyltransferase CheR [Roseomonas sp. 18066]|uniref:CheR family methyltransferase n=1 Tax=Roseomonas sp. 18066 TaxID=2681412 RepID=UPI00135985EB|nr:CheR family methyltransferase [Roseomonas sp. 18066]
MQGPPASDSLQAGLLDGLARLAGLAPSEVLLGRLRRAALLLAGMTEARLPPPDPEDPFWAALLDAVTVQETRLFRAASQLEALAGLVFPGLRALSRPLRLLSAGCATGEEGWTLAALAGEAGFAADVTGIDLCRPALARAATGRFPPGPPDPLRDVPPAYWRHFPRLPDGGARAAPPEGVTVSWSRQNLCELGVPEESFDIILCRNVLIYLTEPARAVVVGGLCARLAPGGALLLGATDAPPPALGLALWSAAQPSLWRRA